MSEFDELRENGDDEMLEEEAPELFYGLLDDSPETGWRPSAVRSRCRRISPAITCNPKGPLNRTSPVSRFWRPVLRSWSNNLT